MRVQHANGKHVKYCPECDELERQATTGLKLADAVLRLHANLVEGLLSNGCKCELCTLARQLKEASREV